jgi:hypothetical protein
MVAQAIGTARAAGASGQILVRGESAYSNRAVVAACVRQGAQFSLVMTRNAAIERAIAAIDADAWTPVRYPGAVIRPTPVSASVMPRPPEVPGLDGRLLRELLDRQRRPMKEFECARNRLEKIRSVVFRGLIGRPGDVAHLGDRRESVIDLSWISLRLPGITPRSVDAAARAPACGRTTWLW